VPAGRVPR
jgi:DNA replication licensing factor MCM2